MEGLQDKLLRRALRERQAEHESHASDLGDEMAVAALQSVEIATQQGRAFDDSF